MIVIWHSHSAQLFDYTFLIHRSLLRLFFLKILTFLKYRLFCLIREQKFTFIFKKCNCLFVLHKSLTQYVTAQAKHMEVKQLKHSKYSGTLSYCFLTILDHQYNSLYDNSSSTGGFHSILKSHYTEYWKKITKLSQSWRCNKKMKHKGRKMCVCMHRISNVLPLSDKMKNETFCLLVSVYLLQW